MNGYGQEALQDLGNIAHMAAGSLGANSYVQTLQQGPETVAPEVSNTQDLGL